MDAYALDWVSLLLRWAHVIVAIAWIGSSFCFVFLDNSLTPPRDRLSIDKGSAAGCGRLRRAYHPQKYAVAPKQIGPPAGSLGGYSTWLTGSRCSRCSTCTRRAAS